MVALEQTDLLGNFSSCKLAKLQSFQSGIIITAIVINLITLDVAKCRHVCC